MIRVPVEIMELVIKEAIARDMEPHRLIAWLLESRYQGVNPPVAGVEIVEVNNDSTDDIMNEENVINPEEQSGYQLNRQPRKLIID
ncbi:hypothetical protein [Fischerella sp. PCC 9605]|uniref:hypothetical protein n=1 Tax=Fischerella sp. PCC 9605 TaxID=1173024 RepID=UPI00047D744F|nr:hypothetical protein [Fischerella sp. PCC 9605]